MEERRRADALGALGGVGGGEAVQEREALGGDDVVVGPREAAGDGGDAGGRGARGGREAEHLPRVALVRPSGGASSWEVARTMATSRSGATAPVTRVMPMVAWSLTAPSTSRMDMAAAGPGAGLLLLPVLLLLGSWGWGMKEGFGLEEKPKRSGRTRRGPHHTTRFAHQTTNGKLGRRHGWP